MARFRLLVMFALLVGLCGVLVPPPQAVSPPISLREDRERIAESSPGGALLARLGDGRLRHCGPVDKSRFHPNGQWVAATAAGENGARLWDITTGEQVRRFTDPDLDPTASRWPNCSVLRFTQDGQRLIVGTDDGRVVVFDTDTGFARSRFQVDGFSYWDLGVSPVGHLVAGIAPNRTLCVWDADTGSTVFKGPMCHGNTSFWSRPSAASFSPDGKRLAICAEFDLVWVCPIADPTAARTVRVKVEREGLMRVQWRGSDRLVAEASVGASVIDAIGGKVLSFDSGARFWGGSRYHHNEKGTRAIEHSYHAIRILDLTRGEPPPSLFPEIDAEPPTPIQELATSANGTRVLTRPVWQTRATLWDISGDRPRKLPALNLWSTRVWLSADGRYAVGSNKTLRVFDVDTGEEVYREEPTDPQGSSTTGVLPAGRVESNSVWTRDFRSGELRELELPSAKVLQRVSGFERSVYIQPSPDGKRIAVGGFGAFAVKDTDPKAAWQVLERYADDRDIGIPWSPRDFAFHPDGRLIALGDRLMIWSGDSAPRPLIVPEGTLEPGLVHRGLLLTPDGRRMLVRTVRGDATRDEVRIYETASLSEVVRLVPGNGVEAIALSADGQRLVISHRDTTLTVWSLDRLEAEQLGNGDPTRWADTDAKVGLAAVRALVADPKRAIALLNADFRRTQPQPRIAPQSVRAVEVLERIGTAEAKLLLTKWSKESVGSTLATEATAAMNRLTMRK